MAVATVSAADEDRPAPIGSVVAIAISAPGGAARSARARAPPPRCSRSSSRRIGASISIRRTPGSVSETNTQPIRQPRRRRRPPLHGHRKHRAAVVIGVLPDQIRPGPAPMPPPWDGWQSSPQTANLRALLQTRVDAGRHLSGGTLGHCVRHLGIIAVSGCAIAGAGAAPAGRGARRTAPSGARRLAGDVRPAVPGRTSEGYGADLSSPALGSDRIPLLADVDARIGRIIGNSGYHINLGALATDAHADVGTGFLGLSLGLTGPITIFGRIPLVRTRVQPAMRFAPAAADGGPNPGDSQSARFLRPVSTRRSPR